MADASRDDVGIVITAQDRSAAGFSSAGRNLEGFKAKLGGLRNSIQAMPDQLGKASTALLLFQGSMSQMGGKAADVANKLTAVAGLIGSGGKLGIAMAGITVAVGTLSKVYETMTAEAKRLEEAQKRLAEQTKKVGEEIDSQKDRLNELRRAYVNFGETQDKVSIEDAEKAVAVAKGRVATLKQTEKQLRTMITLGRDHSGTLQAEVDGIRDQIKAREEGVRTAEAELFFLKENIKATNDKEAAIQRSIEAQKRAERAQKQREAALKEFIASEKEHEEAAKRALEERLAAIDRLANRRQQDRADRLALEESINAARVAHHAEQMARIKAERDLIASTAASVAQGWAITFGEIAGGAEDAGKKVVEQTIRMAETAVQAAVASAAAQAAFSQAGIPIIGPALAVAAAGAMGAFIRTLMADIPKAAFGGVIASGMPGVDSQTVLTQRGEGILQPGQTEKIQRLGDVLDSNGPGGTSPRAGGGANLNLSVNLSALDLTDAPEKAKEILLNLAPPLEELISDGLMLSNLQKRTI